MITSKQRYLLAALLAFISLSTYWYYQPPVFSRFIFSPKMKVAQVGNTPLLGNDILLRIRAMRIFDPTIDEKRATDQLIQGHTFHEILKEKSGPQLQNALTEELKKFESVPSSGWDRAKGFFGNDLSALNKVLIVPTLMDKLIYTEGYLKDAEYHKKERAEAENTLAQAKRDPGRLKELATQRRHFFFEGILDDAKGLSWRNPEKAMAQQLKDGLLIAQTWNRSFFKELKEGQVASQLIDEGSQWLIIRKGSFQKPGAYKIEVVAIAKKPFLKWLEENRSKVSVTRH